MSRADPRELAPDPATEIRPTIVTAVRGANYWSRRPVTRIDLAVGAYDEISSADVPGVPERLHAALPGLVEHRCSVGERGGFLTRLRRGTYAPHIVEHVALELQRTIGHDVGFGRARGGDVPGEYTVVFEHRHERVGLRAATLALDLVQRAFAGTLAPSHVTAAAATLQTAATQPDAPAVAAGVTCGISGGALLGETSAALARLVGSAVLAVVTPERLLRGGLPYARSDVAVISDSALHDVPPRYREPEAAERLLGVLADGVRGDGPTGTGARSGGGLLVAPAAAQDIIAYARDAGCRVAVFAVDGPVAREDAGADVGGWTAHDRLWIEREDGVARDVGRVRPGTAPAAQLAARLAAEGLHGGARAGPAVPD